MAVSLDDIKAKFQQLIGSNSGMKGSEIGEPQQLSAAEEAWDLIKTVAIAVSIALVLRVLIFQPFNIPSGSMKPNLLVGDFLVVSKTSYGYSRASLIWPLTRIPVEGRVFASAPERGEVVVFKNRKDGNRDYIKRVIGMPGDEIEMRGGHLHINGTPIQKDYIGMVNMMCDGRMGSIPAYRETMDNQTSYIVHECHGDQGPLDSTGTYRVPAGHYFMMGDNRDQSQDSRVRHQVGFVPHEDLVGEATMLFFSVDGADAQIWQVWKWPFAIRFGRMFNSIE